MEDALENLKSKKLGTYKIPKLLAMMSGPAILSMLVQAAYNVIDSIYISHYSTQGLEALSIAFAMQMLVGAFSVGLGVAANSCISRYLGEGKREDASNIARLCIIIAFALVVLFAFMALVFARPYMKMYSSDAEIIEMGVVYLLITTCFSFGLFYEMLFNKILQATGNMLVPMTAQLSGAIINIVLDPILIFGLLGFPSMGVMGAAIATITGQIAAMIVGLSFLMVSKSGKEINLSLKKLRVNQGYIKNLVSVAIPVALMNSLASITISLLNLIVKLYNEYGILILGIYFKLQSFIFMPVFGLNQGAMPIMGYNYGANNKRRFVDTYRLAIFVALVMTMLGFLMFQFFPHLIIRMFSAEDELALEAIYAFRCISLSFLPAGVCIVTVGLFNAIGHGVKALSLNLSRQIFLVLPLTFLLGVLFGARGIWFSYGIAEIIVAVVFFPIALRTIQRIFRHSDDVSEGLQNTSDVGCKQNDGKV